VYNSDSDTVALPRAMDEGVKGRNTLFARRRQSNDTGT
jgi:hypothetical protein